MSIYVYTRLILIKVRTFAFNIYRYIEKNPIVNQPSGYLGNNIDNYGSNNL